MEKTIKFGVIGCGLMGREFASASMRWLHLQTNLPRPQIIAACSRTDKSLDWFRRVPDTRYFYHDYHELLENPEVEAVYCAVPHDQHAQIYTDIIRSGKHLLAEKPFEGYDVRAVVGEHVEPQLEVGTLGFRAGKYMAASDELRFRVRGTGGHGAMRKQLKDPVAAGAELLTRLIALNGEECVLSIGRVEAGGATNIVPDEIYMEGTLRTFDERERGIIHRRIEIIAADIDARHGVKTEVTIGRGYPCVVNDEILVKQATALAKAEKLKVEMLPLRTTAEDFGFYCKQYPSLFYRLGVGAAAGRPHTATFFPDEAAIGVGIAYMRKLALQLLEK